MTNDPASDPSREKVAILGGGCGAMAAAFYLTSTEELRQQYEVTVYQTGWRLGGKGATGRDPRPEYGARVYEHGLHMWLGWYHNAFNCIQQVYAEWQKGPNNPFPCWSDAFEAQRFFTLEQDIPAAGGGVRWVTRNFTLPKLPGTPGQDSAGIGIFEYLESLLQWARRMFDQSGLRNHVPADSDPGAPVDPVKAEGAGQMASALSAQGVTDPVPDTAAAHPHLNIAWLAAMRLRILQPLEDMERRLALDVGEHFLQAFQTWLHSSLVRKVAGLNDDLRWYWQLLDFMTAAGLGILRDVIPHGVAYINGQDLSEWLAVHGADHDTAWSAFVRSVYDLAFAFEGGIADRAHARFEAGTALMVMLRMALGYKDAPMFRMRAGMGDTIFAPFYEVLKARGVRFAFFRRVVNLGLSATPNEIESITLEMQAQVKGDAEYAPLKTLTFADGSQLPCWPDEPDWDQLVNGDALKRQVQATGVPLDSSWCGVNCGQQVLRQGVDFQHVVLGISVAGVRIITPELSAVNPAWKSMVEKIGTVQTQAVQMWLKPTLAQMGWNDPPTVLSTYQEPLDTWAEMTEVMRFENWPGVNKPGSLQYLCGPMEGPAEPPLSDPNFPQQASAQVTATAKNWLATAAAHLWPGLIDPAHPPALDYSQLFDPANRQGEARLDAQYLRANIDPSERYVSSFPGTSVFRLWSGKSGFGNLYLAGDWTVSSVNGGCVEAAVESGMAASQAICGVPAEIPNYPIP